MITGFHAVTIGGNTSGGRSSGGASASKTSASGSASGSGAPGGDSVACKTIGATRQCCGTGVQTCDGVVEFASWGPCLDKKGATLDCREKTGCGVGEFGPTCDGGVRDSGVPGSCQPGEFGVTCDAGTSLCTDKTINNEPEILAAYEPASGAAVEKDGQIKVWVNDEWAAFIAPGEQVDNATGAILTPGDRSLKSHDGYLYEPALYIGPDTADKGGTPHFPSAIKGWYNNAPPAAKPKKMAGVTLGTQGAPVDAAPAGTKLREQYTTEFVWNVSELGLAPGSYFAQFVIGDGDYDRAIGCVTIKIR